MMREQEYFIKNCQIEELILWMKDYFESCRDKQYPTGEGFSRIEKVRSYKSSDGGRHIHIEGGYSHASGMEFPLDIGWLDFHETNIGVKVLVKIREEIDLREFESRLQSEWSYKKPIPKIPNGPVSLREKPSGRPPEPEYDIAFEQLTDKLRSGVDYQVSYREVFAGYLLRNEIDLSKLSAWEIRYRRRSFKAAMKRRRFRLP
jgi:hypothetical protein